jgi:uncharacterized membrane protein
MTVWDAARGTSWSARVVLAAGLLAVLLVAAVPVAFFIGVILMVLGHVIGGLALFGASILAAGAAVVLAALTGVRHLRQLVSRQRYRIVQLGQDEYRYN